jgi:hypothetical protein
MQPASRPSCVSANPPFFVQVPLERIANLPQRLGHPQAGRPERAALVVVENSPHRRTIFKHDGVGPGRDSRRDGGRVRGLAAGRFPGLLMPEHGLFDLPQAAHLLPHLNLGMAVRLKDRLGHVTQKMIGAIPMRRLREFRGDPRHKRVLPVRQPQRHGFAQRHGPLPGPGNQAAHFVHRRRDQRLREPHPFLGQFPYDIEGLVSIPLRVMMVAWQGNSLIQTG